MICSDKKKMIMIVTITITGLSILLLASILINVNMLRKIEKQEEYVDEMESTLIGYDTFVARIYVKCKTGLEAARTADRLGSFESDDETGAIFTSLVDIIEDINKEFAWQDQKA
jgi:hypothetical protein